MAAARTPQDEPRLRVVEPGVQTDAELVARFQRGPRAAFDSLVQRHQALVVAVVRRFAANSDEARELAQRAFVRAFEALERRRALPFSREADFRAWVVRIALNLAKNHARDRRAHRPELIEVAAALPDRSVSPDERIATVERAREVRRAIVALPRRQREALTLRVDGELSFKEVAEVLSTTENNAKVLFHYALKRLKAALNEEARDGL